LPEKWYNIRHRYGGKETRRRQNEVFGYIPHGRGALPRIVFSNRRISMNMTTTYRRMVDALVSEQVIGRRGVRSG